jgi:hypothetical protein
MVNSRRHNHQIALLQPYPDPLVALVPHIEVSSASQNVPNLLIFVQMLVEESLHFLFVAWEGRWRDLDGVAVLVLAFGGDGIDGGLIVGEEVVVDP